MRGINIIYENYQYQIKKTDSKYYLKCIRCSGATMNTNPDITEIIRQPGNHNHDTEEAHIEYEAMRQKILRKIKTILHQ